MLLHLWQVRLGEDVDQIMPGERLRAIAANRVHCKQLWFVGQSSAYGAIVTKVEASTRSHGVYGVSPHACRGVVKQLELAKKPDGPTAEGPESDRNGY